ncbi:RecF/RecN/SMC [Phakopsora pachyrhizi]|nr:RecF/RecN/SMC [Phakopsora pachyrhizi]
MPLVSIEVLNFKSYKGTQVIGPFKHFTAVVGPNGAGKSNLMDAISFVLGIRSGQLRSTQLRDLIYKHGDHENDCDTTKQANKASVTAVYLDHKTGEEFRFCRTVTVSSDKSGSSFYSINRKTTKWDDYQAALESHNILVKAKNFLVFQGDVEAIASQNPKTLCKLLDQISGSLELAPEYEKRKVACDDANKQFNEQSIKRRTINGEIKDLKQQKAEIEKYHRLCSERDEAIVHHLLWKLYHIERQIVGFSKSIREKNLTLDPLRAEIEEFDKLMTSARKEYTQVTKNVLKAERDLKAKEKWKEEEKIPRLMECEERIKHLEKKRFSEEKSMLNVNNEKASKEKNIESLKKDLSVVVEARDAFYARQVSTNPSMALSESQLKEYQVIKGKSLSRCTSERAKVKKLQQDIKTKTDKLSKIEDDIEQIQNRRKRLDQDHDAQTNNKTMFEYKIDSLNRELGKIRKQLADTNTERTRQAQTETELTEKLQDCLRKITEAGAAQHETNSEQRIRLMVEKLRKTFPGVQGRLQDLCTPAARKHETAIRIVLGKNLDAVVVDTQKTAIDCVEYLKNQRLGKAMFIPLDTISVNPVNERLRNLEKGVRLAIDLIKHDPIHERAIQHACGNTVICDTLQLARLVIYERGNELKAVTLDGTVIHKGGNITGGVSGLESSRKFDERELQGLKRVQEEILSLIKQNSQKVPRNADESFLAEIGRLENDIARLKDELLATETRLTSIMAELKSLGQQENDLRKKIFKGRSELDTIKKDLNATQAVVEAAEDNFFDSFCKSLNINNIREYEGHHLQIQEQRSEEQERLETTVSKLEHQISFEEEQIEGLNERQLIIAAAQKKTLQSLEAAKDLRLRIQNEIQAIDDEISELNSRFDELVTSQAEKSNRAAEAKAKLSKITKAFDDALRDISSWNDEISRLASERLNIYRRCKIEDISLPLKEGSISRIPIDETVTNTDPEEGEGTQEPVDVRDYGIKIDYQILDDKEKEPDPEVERNFIEALGQLNSRIEVMAPKGKAIEKLGEAEVRLREHDEEYESARKQFKKTKEDFNEIKKRRVEAFNKAYNHVSGKIGQVYKELTSSGGDATGGYAFLGVENPDEPYLSGLKYNAMPPMKRYRDMEQLSGGEKTMAALALLFAIHSYQPSPFFVLDEVDAALDNTNVRRIANYIGEKSGEDFQFVVISLKSSFYERANGLVGIYRDNDWGGTKNLTLDLDQYAD